MNDPTQDQKDDPRTRKTKNMTVRTTTETQKSNPRKRKSHAGSTMNPKPTPKDNYTHNLQGKRRLQRHKNALHPESA